MGGIDKNENPPQSDYLEDFFINFIILFILLADTPGVARTVKSNGGSKEGVGVTGVMTPI